MKISSDTYMMMQAQLLSSMAPVVEGFVNPAYVKAHIDKLLDENKCTVIDSQFTQNICQAINEIQDRLQEIRDKMPLLEEKKK